MARRRPLRYLGPWLVTAATAGAIVAGWAWRDEGHLTPEQGLGYWLGIAGATAMLLLLVYPLRKRMPSLRWLGGIPAWFQLHMLLGVLGPLLILYHCNFSFGAPNSNIALSTMLVVAASGVVGRYLYG
ncbi:MAG: pyridine nucleotide-disulfide oxidoreductase, partial [Hyphomicrobium sp.]